MVVLWSESLLPAESPFSPGEGNPEEYDWRELYSGEPCWDEAGYPFRSEGAPWTTSGMGSGIFFVLPEAYLPERQNAEYERALYRVLDCRMGALGPRGLPLPLRAGPCLRLRWCTRTGLNAVQKRPDHRV